MKDLITQEKETGYIDLLKSELSLALGCTEPAAAALTAAYAAKEATGTIKEITVNVSQYILKNGMNVGIPSIGMIGLDIAVALGILSASPEKELMVLTDLSEDIKNEAKEMVKLGMVNIGLAKTTEKVYIEVLIKTEQGSSRAVISQSHKNLTLLEKNGEVIYNNVTEPVSNVPLQEGSNSINLTELLTFVKTVDIEKLDFLKDVLKINGEISKEGLINDYGLKVGKSMMQDASMGIFTMDIANYAIACTAAAADARMAGCDKPVMSAAGSGNQGLTASLPVAAVGEKLNRTEEEILRALALSILITISTKRFIGRLSVLCACGVAASIGTCCGVILLLGGNELHMEDGINTMVADISGVICDGAKPGCALKIATAVTSALRAADLAMKGIGANHYDGIVTIDVEKTLINLGVLSNEGMKDTNATILEMMLDK